jgi:DNA-binding transcriptional ArsR family regulator
MLAALGSEPRLRIVELLIPGERCVCEITPQFELDPSVVSRHLAILGRAGIVTGRREGRWIYYRIADQRVLRLLEIARRMASQPEAGKPVGRRSRKEGRC